MDIACKWIHTVCDLVYLLSFILHVLRLIHGIAYVSTSFILWLNNAPLNGYATICLSIYPVDEHVDKFYLE